MLENHDFSNICDLHDEVFPGPEQQKQQPRRKNGGKARRGAPRGRPFVKGQSGNPKGRPRLPRLAAIVAQHMIAEHAGLLTDKLIRLALEGDRAALRMCLDRILPPRREAPLPLHMPPAGAGGNSAEAIAALLGAAADGDLGAAQAAGLIRLLSTPRPTATGIAPAAEPAPEHTPAAAEGAALAAAGNDAAGNDAMGNDAAGNDA